VISPDTAGILPVPEEELKALVEWVKSQHPLPSKVKVVRGYEHSFEKAIKKLYRKGWRVAALAADEDGEMYAVLEKERKWS
jgi:predicted GNAT superfamily acetyltransferase